MKLVYFIEIGFREFCKILKFAIWEKFKKGEFYGIS